MRLRAMPDPAPANRFDLSVREVRVPGGRARLRVTLLALTDAIARRARRPVALSFVVIGDATMRTLNRESLAHDYATDVLAFPYAEEPVLEGEVILSADTARREAAARGHEPLAELVLYAVHGCLHLLGHDDHDPVGRRRMRAAERRLLRGLGFPAVYGPGSDA